MRCEEGETGGQKRVDDATCVIVFACSPRSHDHPRGDSQLEGKPLLHGKRTSTTSLNVAVVVAMLLPDSHPEPVQLLRRCSSRVCRRRNWRTIWYGYRGIAPVM